jgi:MFS transporter, APGE family, 1-arseno-3-phosphoglycerate exporter
MRGLRDYAVITASYWAFTLTDGALRMLVLLYLHQLGRSPLEIASLFLFYEFFGVVTNFVGGWVGARFGLKSTLVVGLMLQVVALALLGWRAAALTVPVVLIAQALSGVAKDLTKMSSKSYVKLLVPAGDAHGLMRWVAVLTGSKNTLKGVGFFLGGLLLTQLGFRGACVAMAVGLAVALIASITLLPRAAGKSKGTVALRTLISRDARVNWLSAGRLFLFGSRDIWFVLALPVFLTEALGWNHTEVGGALAIWVIGYGLVQASAPRWLGAKRGKASAAALGRWILALAPVLAGIWLGIAAGFAPALVLAVGLSVFGLVFATNSALHSYLIVAYAEQDTVALKVGFYYMANAMGRFVGTLLSGALYQLAGAGERGLLICIAGSTVFVLISAGLCIPLRAAERRHDALLVGAR